MHCCVLDALLRMPVVVVSAAAVWAAPAARGTIKLIVVSLLQYSLPAASPAAAAAAIQLQQAVLKSHCDLS
jgi:hypothetical protein